jgi:GNAT superfamily N-acetyltransferase
VRDEAGSGPVIRTAVAADLPDLQRVFRAASLSNQDDAPLLLARPEFLAFAGDGIAQGRTRVAVAGRQARDFVLGFATVAQAPDGGLELEDLFVDPVQRRRGIARHLVFDAVGAARRAGHQGLSVIGNPHALAFYLALGFVQRGPAGTELGAGLRLHLDFAAGLDVMAATVNSLPAQAPDRSCGTRALP